MSCKLLVPSRLHELDESKLRFVSHIEFIRSKLSNFSAHVSGVIYRKFSADMHHSWLGRLTSERPGFESYQLLRGRSPYTELAISICTSALKPSYTAVDIHYPGCSLGWSVCCSAQLM